MKYIHLFLIITLIVGAASAAPLIRLDQLNKTQSWNSPLHGITNGTGQDAATVSQTTAAIASATSDFVSGQSAQNTTLSNLASGQSAQNNSISNLQSATTAINSSKLDDDGENLLSDVLNKSSIGTYISGTSGYIPKFTGTNAIAGNSPMYTDGTNISIGHAAPMAVLHTTSPSNYDPSLTYSSPASAIINGAGVDLAFGVASLPPYSMWLQSRSSTDSQWAVALNPLGGDVGINTVAPAYPLDVNGAINTESYLQMTGIGTPDAPGANALCVYSKLGQLWYRNATGDYYVGGGNASAGGGDFYGVASSTTDDIITFANTGGKTAKDSGKKLSDLVYKDGSTTMTGDLPMGGYKVTGAANGTAAQDLVTYSQLENGITDNDVTVGPYGWCDFVTDNSSDYIEIQAAVDYAADHDKNVVLAAGGFTPVGQIIIPKDLKFTGAADIYSWEAGHPGDGTVLYITNTTHPAIVFYRDTEISGLQAVWPNQKYNSAPDVYPAFLEAAQDGGAISDCKIHHNFALNPYIFINCAAAAVGRNDIYNNYGYPIKYGIRYHTGRDVSRIYRNHFWPFLRYPGAQDVLNDWISQNGIAIDCYDCNDGTIISENCAFGYKMGISLDLCDGFILTNNICDAVRLPIYLVGTYHTKCLGNQLVSWSWPTDYSNGLYGILIEGGGHNNIVANDVIAGNMGVVVSASVHNNIDGNSIGFNFGNGVSNTGIYVQGSSTTTKIHGNTIDGAGFTGSHGIAITDSSWGIASDNIISSCGASAMYLVNTDYYVKNGNVAISCAAVIGSHGANSVTTDNIGI